MCHFSSNAGTPPFLGTECIPISSAGMIAEAHVEGFIAILLEAILATEVARGERQWGNWLLYESSHSQTGACVCFVSSSLPLSVFLYILAALELG